VEQQTKNSDNLDEVFTSKNDSENPAESLALPRKNNKQKMRFFFGLIAWVWMVVVLISCQKFRFNTNENDEEPIIQTGDFFPNSNWNDPCVLLEGDKWIMYASASQNLDQNVQIYRLVSQDGKRWELNPTLPVFSRSSSLYEWDSKSVETPSVVKYRGKYHLFYTGYRTQYNDALNFKIGHAVSLDGIHWNKDYGFLLEPTAPLSLPNYNFNQYIVGEPGAVVFQDKIFLYFSAVGFDDSLNTTTQSIGLTILDGQTWSEPKQVFQSNLPSYPREEYVGFSTPSAWVDQGRVHLYFDVIQDNPWKQVKIHHAESSNGISAWSTDSQCLLSRENYSWTKDEIRSPSVVRNQNHTYLYFAGNTGLNLCIGRFQLD
jgi:sucrose-6-phosphate hydrolase SacC (GH32 family)